MTANPALEEGQDFTPRWNDQGLIAAIAVDAGSGDVLMLAWMNGEALQKTLETGQAHYWSRSRKALWHKGETSGAVQIVRDIRVDCDQDALLLIVEQQGSGACHTGRKSCFYRKIENGSLKPVPAAGQRKSCRFLMKICRTFDSNFKRFF